LVLAIPVPALARAEINKNLMEKSSVHISYRIANLASENCREELELKIPKAAAKVCGSLQLRKAVSIKQLAENHTY
jgi:UrcA family protein